MGLLENKSKNLNISPDVRIADNMVTRMRGLLGSEPMPLKSCLWIKRCNTIHTFFMGYSIDAIFVDKKLKVKSIHYDLKPWKVTFPKLGAYSVFEFTSGSINKGCVGIGDQLEFVA